jgi:hypothetical protein
VTAQPPSKYIDTKYLALSGIRSVSGQDAQTLQTDPRFLDGPGGNYRFAAGLAAIDSGDSGSPHGPRPTPTGSLAKTSLAFRTPGPAPLTTPTAGRTSASPPRWTFPVQIAVSSSDLRLAPNPMRGRGTLSHRLESWPFGWCSSSIRAVAWCDGWPTVMLRRDAWSSKSRAPTTMAGRSLPGVISFASGRWGGNAPRALPAPALTLPSRAVRPDGSSHSRQNTTHCVSQCENTSHGIMPLGVEAISRR